MQKTLGGDRLGSGKKQKIALRNYERSTHDLSYPWRSSMSAGTLVPFMVEIGLPGDTFDITLNSEVLTHPTIGPLFGSLKEQLDVFMAPIRLYNGRLHNNELKIGMNMSQIKLPQLKLQAVKDQTNLAIDADNAQINPSCLLSYIGIRGVGIVSVDDTEEVRYRYMNGTALLMYWDVIKNYYANKQEEEGVVVHTQRRPLVDTVTSILVNGTALSEVPATTSPAPGLIRGQFITVLFTGGAPVKEQILINTSNGQYTIKEILGEWFNTVGGFIGQYDGKYGPLQVINWQYVATNQSVVNEIELLRFPLENIDNMRKKILQQEDSLPFVINEAGIGAPYDTLLNWDNTDPSERLSPYISTQEGLGIKTYQSDLLNNWINTEWIDGPGGITELTAIDTSGGSFTIDQLNIAQKVYKYLNYVGISGGTYDDWQDAVWSHDRYIKCETPMYMGGLSKEVVFQSVISNSESSSSEGVPQPLGTLAGRGVMSGKHKGGNIRIKIDEPSYIMGIVSLTPRTDYSQGNKWDTGLQTVDDLHKPILDEIGFQELITEQMGWFDTKYDYVNDKWQQKSAGKQPAWTNYMTNLPQTRGNFAMVNNEMFMTLNRRYTYETSAEEIEDITTYIDPSKFNFIFAATSLDSQNYWTQIAVNMTVRRKMSAKVMPNI